MICEKAEYKKLMWLDSVYFKLQLLLITYVQNYIDNKNYIYTWKFKNSSNLLTSNGIITGDFVDYIFVLAKVFIGEN